MLGLLISLCFISLSKEKDVDIAFMLFSFASVFVVFLLYIVKFNLTMRAILDMTQQELAVSVGVSRQTINSIESGKYVPSTILALKIARYFYKPVEQIFSLEDLD